MGAAQQMMALSRPARASYESVVNYVSDRKPAVFDERSWVYWKEDMVTLRPGREHAWLDTGLERILRAFHCSLIEARYTSTSYKLIGKLNCILSSIYFAPK